MLLFGIALFGLMSSIWALATPISPTPTPNSSLPPSSYANTSRFVYFHGESMCTVDPKLGCAVGVKNVSGLAKQIKFTTFNHSKMDYLYVAILLMSWEP